MEETKEVAVVNQDLITALRENSGEGNGNNYPFVPLIKVDNSKEETEVNGRMTKVLCAPQLRRTDKVGEEYKNTPIPNFGGVILLVKWQVFNRGNWDANKKEYVANDAPFFTSRFFDPVCLFGKKEIDIKLTDTGEILSMTYPDIKAKFGKNFKLVGTIYVLFGNEVVRVVVAGSSRGALFDLLKLIKQNDSVSAHKVVFGAKYVSDVENPYNTLTIDIKDDVANPIDFARVIECQKQLKELFGSQKAEEIAEIVEGEVMSEDDIKVENIKFD